jgi:hypothetical protein
MNCTQLNKTASRTERLLVLFIKRTLPSKQLTIPEILLFLLDLRLRFIFAERPPQSRHPIQTSARQGLPVRRNRG